MNCSKRKLLGQHNLIDPKIVARIVEISNINKNESVCELGAGDGVLTNELCRHAGSVISFEIDYELYKKLRPLRLALPNLRLVNSDFFKIKKNTKFDVFISNLPYSKSREIFQWLSLQKFNRAILMVQKEFVDKLLANPGERNYRVITVLTQYRFHIQRLFNVKKESFDPEPSIESEVIRLFPKSKSGGITEQTIFNLNLLFSHRNRQARSILKRYGFELGNDYSDDIRIDQLPPFDLINLARSLYRINN
jgi:16S rRNA (adenine1518-N6/adenine1519-N6)-dimethyltransferase